MANSKATSILTAKKILVYGSLKARSNYLN